MPSIMFYADEADLGEIVEYLNNEPSIAFIVSSGPTSWKAVDKVNHHYLHEKTYLWHIPGGKLPLVVSGGDDLIIDDPFVGWEDHSPDDLDYRTTPYFGPGCTVTFDLTFKQDNPSIIGLSTFGWIGNHYSIIGNPAPEVTKKFWGNLRSWISKHSVKKISRSGQLDEGKKEVYAFRYAYEKILAGMDRDDIP
jgi:hypothetical protein